jgi:hypothetical protein
MPSATPGFPGVLERISRVQDSQQKSIYPQGLGGIHPFVENQRFI